MRGFNKICSDANGAVAVYVAIIFATAVGIVGLALDVGYWFYDKARLQNLSDIAAYAALSERRAGGTSKEEMEAAAFLILSTSGFDNVSGLEVDSPPTDGAFEGNANYVQAKITQQFEPYLSKVIGQNPFEVTVRSVVGYETTPSGNTCCLCSLAETGSSVIEIQGTADVSIDNCGIATNSNDEDAYQLNGAITVTASCMYSFGDPPASSDLPSGVDLVDCNDTPEKMNDLVNDPYADAIASYEDDILNVVNAGQCVAVDGNGNYVNEIALVSHVCSSVCGNVSLPCTVFKPAGNNAKLSFPSTSGNSIATVTLLDGLYILDNVDLEMTNDKQVLEGSNITFILLNNSSIKITGGQLGSSDAPLTARSQAPFKGLLFASINNSSANAYQGNGDANYEGALYFPNGSLTMTGSSSIETGNCAQYIAGELIFRGTTNVSIENCVFGEGNILEGVEIVQESFNILLVE